MESHSLQSASIYLNNLLLARGLLQNGKSIDFANPGHENNGTDATMSRIINLVHDLVLRRDRDADQRENLASNIRTMRAEEGQRILDLQKIQDKNGELTRNIATTEAQERTWRTAARKAESQAKELREQMLKMKSTLDQVRAKCLNDVKKRDVELEKLRGHLAAMQRGKREASGMKINIINPQPASNGREIRGGQDVQSAEWSLEKETNDFLAVLVNETSTENVSLRKIVQDSMDTLKELTGLESAQDSMEVEDDGVGIPGQYRKSRRTVESSLDDSIISCDTLADQMNSILEHCRSILKDPSFVPIEEVQVREEEIIKLRVGWEKMAARWKEAVTMMDSWRRRMEGNEAVNVNELTNLAFGRSIAVLPDGQPVLGENDELSSILFEHSHLEEYPAEDDMNKFVTSETEDNLHQELEEDESDLDIPPEPAPKRLAASPPKRGVKLPSVTKPLQESNTNSNRRARNEDSKLRTKSRNDQPTFDRGEDAENDDPTSNLRSKIPRPESGRASQPRPTVQPVQPLSVFEKLAAIEAEAKEAEELRQQEQVTHKRKPVKPRVNKGSRRRSTLSPEELASLMGVK